MISNKSTKAFEIQALLITVDVNSEMGCLVPYTIPQSFSIYMYGRGLHTQRALDFYNMFSLAGDNKIP